MHVDRHVDDDVMSNGTPEASGDTMSNGTPGAESDVMSDDDEADRS
jgi:hypothetical protein